MKPEILNGQKLLADGTYVDMSVPTRNGKDGRVLLTQEEIAEELAKAAAADQAKANYEANHKYKDDRAREYPPLAEFADAYVKIQSGNPDGETQMTAYLAACLAVKAKYPKPESNA